MKKIILTINLFLTLPLMADETVHLAVLNLTPDDMETRLRGISTLIVETIKRTNIDINSSPEFVSLGGKIFNYPFILITGDSSFSLNDEKRRILRDYLQMGGTLFIDNSGGVKGNSFDRAIRREIKNIFPEKDLEPVPQSHVLFRTFYLLKNPTGRVIAQSYLEGINISGRYAVIYSLNDLFGALARNKEGGWLFDVYPGDERQREFAIRLGVNILMYALTLDYKDDKVHQPFIIRRERR